MTLQTNSAQKSPPASGRLKRAVVTRFLLSIVFFGMLFFLPAGTFRYWEAWIYMGILLIPMMLVLRYFLKHDPALLERRMAMKERVREQKRIIGIGNLFIVAAFLIPGFDHRYDWSSVPPIVVLIADLFILFGYAFFVRVLKENSYASRIIVVEKNQTLVDTGPYGVVRHPMYAGVLLMFLFSPLALGSYWAMLPITAIPFVIVARILNEEAVLTRDLEGYTEYRMKVRYRLIPGLW